MRGFASSSRTGPLRHASSSPVAVRWVPHEGGADTCRAGMGRMSKPTLKAELLALLTADLETLERAHRATREGATHEEAKPENDKDTRALEQSYLARGQAARIEELRLNVALVSALPVKASGEAPATLGSLMTVEEDGEVSM